jgi:AhpD family alkylhydroperoxidase
MTPRIDYMTVAPEAFKAILSVERYARNSGLEKSLLYLIKLRASYMNGCAYCVDMHTKEARHVGETEQRVYAIPVWRETPFFTARERAALLWTESVTDIGRSGVSDETYDEVRAQFTEIELVNLTMAIVAINAWNRMAISFRSEVGSFQVTGGQQA